jgi:hypothetical protein
MSAGWPMNAAIMFSRRRNFSTGFRPALPPHKGLAPSGELSLHEIKHDGFPASFVQMRWKTSVPRTLVTRPFGATYVAIPLVATVVGLTKRPDQTVVALQSGVQFLDVWNTTRGPRTRPTRS